MTKRALKRGYFKALYTGAIYQMVGQIADALGGVGWDALALALGHITPEIRVHAGADLGQGNGELVGGEEPGVFRLTAGDGVQGHQGRPTTAASVVDSPPGLVR